ncbi:MAG: zinc ribbon domain-containing protein [Burkholderiaceae bacterium]
MNTPSTGTASPIGGLSTDAFSSMFQAISGLRNRRALLAMLGCLFAGVLVAGLFSFMAARMGFFFAFLGGLLMFAAGATGVNAAGLLLMDQAKGVPARSLSDAVMGGLLCIPKFIALGLALLLVTLAVFIAVALVYLVCKIPFLGPLLFVVVFPLSVVVLGLTLCGLFQCLFLALPAIWEGSSIAHAIAKALSIVRSRLVESMLLLTVVGFLSLMVGFIVFGVLITGLIPSAGLMAGILGGDGLASVFGMLRGFGMEQGGYGGGSYGGGRGGSGVGHLAAAAIGGGLLWALAASLVSLVYLLGLNLVYLRVTEGLDVGATEAAMQAGFDDAKRRAAELSQKAKDAAERARAQARASAAAAQAGTAAATTPPAYSAAQPVATPPAVPATALCPKCTAPVGADDLFCGVCGFKLK